MVKTGRKAVRKQSLMGKRAVEGMCRRQSVKEVGFFITWIITCSLVEGKSSHKVFLHLFMNVMHFFITERHTITSYRGPTACCHLFLRSSSSAGVSFTPVYTHTDIENLTSYQTNTDMSTDTHTHNEHRSHIVLALDIPINKVQDPI